MNNQEFYSKPPTLFIRKLKIHYRVQHTVGRDEPLSRLLAYLPPEVEVITDYEVSDPNPMRNYLRCLADPPPAVTHLCIVQDDALPCQLFTKKVETAVANRPADVISLFVGGLSNRTRKDFYEAMKHGDLWTKVYFRDIHHVVGMVWPVQLADEFLQWYSTKRVPGPTPPRSDDAVVGYWARTTKHQVWATVPCLVQHPDDYPSTIRTASRFGDKGRRAIHFEE